MKPVTVAAMYKFVKFSNYRDFREPLLKLMKENGIKGTLLLADEGINGTVAGSYESIQFLISWLKKDPRFSDLGCKFSYDESIPFNRVRVKLKKEIVTMGIHGIDPLKTVGTYISPADWNQLISDPEVLLIDTRNEYETRIGTFQNALIPHTDHFRQFPEYIRRNVNKNQHKKVAMFCTGGIRCEKATAYLKEMGFEEVFHLQGGILNYLEKVNSDDSMWDGECFVFDRRVSVNHLLEKGSYDQCHACRMPITEEEKNSPQYTHGVSCPHCFNQTTEKQKERFLQRQKQIDLAEKRGEFHIGSEAVASGQRRRSIKKEKKLKEAEIQMLKS
ncbi:MAG: rhodanese-related sulfurtransferase [Spirochaetia bacterium]|nr:rhodanese-related sulfurtransferase [Spirochaetia bacterium]